MQPVRSAGNLAASFAAGATLAGVTSTCRAVRRSQLQQVQFR